MSADALAALGLPVDVIVAIDRSERDLLAWASWYADMGVKPLPRGRGGKHPRVAWTPFQDRHPTADERTAWFSDAGTTGIVAVLDETHYVVLELDAANPDRLPDAYGLLTQAGIAIPHACPRVISGSGRSEQLWFRAPRPVPGSGRAVAALVHPDGPAKAGGAQVDILAKGIIVLPPTPHHDTGKPYAWRPPWLERERVPMLQAAVYSLIDRQPTQPRLEPVAVDAPILEGTRERMLCSILGAARRRGANQAELLALAEATNRRCQPPLGDRDLARLTHSIAKYPPEEALIDYVKLFASVEPAPAAAGPNLTFRTPADLATVGRVGLDYVLPPYLVAGAITDLIAPPKLGKTRLRNYWISCAIRGACCLGLPPTPPTPVILLTEETSSPLLEGLTDAGLLDTRDLHILTLFEGRDADWPAMVAAAQQQAVAVGARLLIIDTVPVLARLEGDTENSSGHTLAALRPLQEAAGAGLAVLTIRHDRKAGGVLVDRGRGSSAWAGGCDVLVGMSRPRGAKRTVRRLEAVGRFDRVPTTLLVERVETADATHTYEALPPAEDEDADATPARIRLADRLLAILPRTEADAITVAALAQGLDAPETSVKSALKTLPRVVYVGAGTKGQPARVWIRMNPSPPSDGSSESSSSESGIADRNTPENIPTKNSDEVTLGTSSSSSELRKEDTPMADRPDARAPPHDRDSAQTKNLEP